MHRHHRLPLARGSIFKRHGGYAFRVDAGLDPGTGKRKQVLRQGFRTKREAEAALDAFIGEVRSGDTVNRSLSTLGEFLEHWLEGQRTQLKLTTWESYRIGVARATARMGKIRLQALTASDVESFYRGLAVDGGRNGQPLAAKTIRNNHVV